MFLSPKIKTKNFILEEDAKLFYGSAETSFWIGGNNLICSNIWRWTDGSNLNYTNWKNGQPKNTTDSNCAALSLTDGYWIAEDCFKPKPFVFGIFAAPTYPILANCSNGWTYIAATHSCYGVDYPGLVSS